VNCNQELCIELLSIINCHCEREREYVTILFLLLCIGPNLAGFLQLRQALRLLARHDFDWANTFNSKVFISRTDYINVLIRYANV
jgi:hypothetical protein